MYIDAGSGSMLLQAGTAVLFTCIIFFRQIVAAVKNAFHRNGK